MLILHIDNIQATSVMDIPLSLADLRFWVSLVTIILVVTNELISPTLGRHNLYINRKRLRNVTYFFVLLFILLFIGNIIVSYA